MRIRLLNRVRHLTRLTEIHEGEIPPSLDLFLDYIDMDKGEFYKICESMQVFPHKRDKTKNYKISEKTKDFDEWFRER